MRIWSSFLGLLLAVSGLAHLPPGVLSASTATAGGGGASAYSAVAPAPSSQWSLAGETRSLYDGWLVIHERDGNTPTVSYTRGRDLSGSLQGVGGIGGLLARSAGYGSGNGNVTFLLAENQTLAARNAHDPYGNSVSQASGLRYPRY